jgi:hypothetical protein
MSVKTLGFSFIEVNQILLIFRAAAELALIGKLNMRLATYLYTGTYLADPTQNI